MWSMCWGNRELLMAQKVDPKSLIGETNDQHVRFLV